MPLVSLMLLSFYRTFFSLIPGLLLVLSTTGWSMADPGPRYQLASHETPVALLTAGRQTLLVTEHSVLQLSGRQFVCKYQSVAPIQCALTADTAVWLGTRQGAVRLSTRQFRAQAVALPGPAEKASVTAVCRDAAGGIWLGALGYGVFRLANGRMEKALSVPTVSAALVTADSSVWIGSTLGLNRFQHEQWTRYNEEGVANLEIPDNLVDKLLPDNTGNLWVIMSAGVSVFPGGGAAVPVELPTTSFIGRPGNEVFSVACVPGAGRVFATAMGLLLLPDAPAGQFASFEPSVNDKVEQKRVLLPLVLPGTSASNLPRLIQVDRQQRVWLVSSQEVRVISGKEFRRLVKS
jgi:ligand-binding sensor domain-containing protein